MERLYSIAELFDVYGEQHQCPECGHILNDDGGGHYHDCRFFTLEDEDLYDEEADLPASVRKELPGYDLAA